MEEDTKMLGAMCPDKNFINSILNFDVRSLEKLSSAEVSQYVVALSQYLIYFKYQFNSTKMLLNREERLLEVSLTQLMTDEIIKKYKTKKDARVYLIYNIPTLNKIQLIIDTLHDEVFLLSGIDKTISELIAAFKRELTRRENELYQTRNS
jgi:hypothetical protein